jgi:hypothetical protein
MNVVGMSEIENDTRLFLYSKKWNNLFIVAASISQEVIYFAKI